MNSALRGAAVFISAFGGRGRSTHFERALFPAGTRSSSLELFFTHADPSGLPGETVPDIVTRGKEKTLPAMPANCAKSFVTREESERGQKGVVAPEVTVTVRQYGFWYVYTDKNRSDEQAATAVSNRWRQAQKETD